MSDGVAPFYVEISLATNYSVPFCDVNYKGNSFLDF